MNVSITTGLAIVVVALGATPSAAVNCAQVNRYLATGRSTQDVAETMVVPEEEVKKCQAEAASAASSGAAQVVKPAAPAAAPAAGGK